MASTKLEDLEAQVESLERRLKTWVASRGKVWAVVFSNYDPPELDTLWNSEAAAKARVDKLNGDWNVVEMTVHEAEE